MLTGLALSEAEKWLKARGSHLLPREAALITASLKKREEDHRDVAAQRQKELLAAQALAEAAAAKAEAETLARKEAEARQLTERSAHRRTQTYVRLLAALLLVASGAGAWAFYSQFQRGRALNQVIQNLRANLATDDPRQVVSTVDQLISLHRRPPDEIANGYPQRNGPRVLFGSAWLPISSMRSRARTHDQPDGWNLQWKVSRMH